MPRFGGSRAGGGGPLLQGRLVDVAQVAQLLVTMPSRHLQKYRPTLSAIGNRRVSIR